DKYSTDGPIHSWLTHSSAAKDELKDIVTNHPHPICPLHAYDAMGKLIPPHMHQARLQGVTTRVHFLLSHTCFKN
ncbi:hypothetical protein J3R83DRAFT_7492, partial [Lanmaoa asiatica]